MFVEQNAQRVFSVLFFAGATAKVEWPTDIWHALRKVTPNDAGLKIQLTSRRPEATYARVCTRARCPLFFHRRIQTVVGKLHCLHKEPRGAKTSEGTIFGNRGARGSSFGKLTDWLTDRSILGTLRENWSAQSAVDLPPVHAKVDFWVLQFFFRGMHFTPGKKKIKFT